MALASQLNRARVDPEPCTSHTPPRCGIPNTRHIAHATCANARLWFHPVYSCTAPTPHPGVLSMSSRTRGPHLVVPGPASCRDQLAGTAVRDVTSPCAPQHLERGHPKLLHAIPPPPPTPAPHILAGNGDPNLSSTSPVCTRHPSAPFLFPACIPPFPVKPSPPPSTPT